MAKKKKTTKTKKSEKTEKKKKAVTDNKSVKSRDDFAVVKIKHFQEKVSVGDEIELNRMKGKEGSKLKFDQVLLTHKDGKTVVGKPNVKGAEVEMEIVEHLKGPKLRIKTYKAKSRYRRHVGHRQHLTKLKVTNIKF
ncbi:50S ribosomal protein L21 [Candidatus Dojkabacteria bacterium]|nr:50S ribosomal protein L21 [Candidatus Dojkabacteria bacterium]